jgi:hypothetical protein
MSGTIATQAGRGPEAPGWVRSWESGRSYMESLNGLHWADAPTPCWLHRCRAQTRAQLGRRYVEQCACGAMRRRERGWWGGKNETRRHRVRIRLQDLVTSAFAAETAATTTRAGADTS